MLQEIIVGIIVAAALLHASTKYLPLAARRRLVAVLARCGIAKARLAAWFKTDSACGGCSSCGSDKPKTKRHGDSGEQVIKLHPRQR